MSESLPFGLSHVDSDLAERATDEAVCAGDEGLGQPRGAIETGTPDRVAGVDVVVVRRPVVDGGVVITVGEEELLR